MKRLVRFSFIGLLIYAGMLGLTWLGFNSVPSGFIPEQDQGYAIVVGQLPSGASLDRTDAVVQRIVDKALQVEGLAHAVAFAGFNGATFTNSSNSFAIFTPFAPFEERIKSGRNADAILADLRVSLSGIQEAFVIVIPPPSVRGIGNGGGFKMILQDQAGLGYETIQNTAYN